MGNLKLGGNTPDNMYSGSQEIRKILIGTELVWTNPSLDPLAETILALLPDYYWPMTEDTARDEVAVDSRMAGYNGIHQYGNNNDHNYQVYIPATRWRGHQNDSRYARSSTKLSDSVNPPAEATFFGIHYGDAQSNSSNSIVIPGRYDSSPWRFFALTMPQRNRVDVDYGGQTVSISDLAPDTYKETDFWIVRLSSTTLLVDSARRGRLLTLDISATGWHDPAWTPANGPVTWSAQNVKYDHDRGVTSATSRDEQQYGHSGVFHRFLNDSEVSSLLAAYESGAAIPLTRQASTTTPDVGRWNLDGQYLVLNPDDLWRNNWVTQGRWLELRRTSDYRLFIRSPVAGFPSAYRIDLTGDLLDTDLVGEPNGAGLTILQFNNDPTPGQSRIGYGQAWASPPYPYCSYTPEGELSLSPLLDSQFVNRPEVGQIFSLSDLDNQTSVGVHKVVGHGPNGRIQVTPPVTAAYQAAVLAGRNVEVRGIHPGASAGVYTYRHVTDETPNTQGTLRFWGSEEIRISMLDLSGKNIRLTADAISRQGLEADGGPALLKFTWPSDGTPLYRSFRQASYFSANPLDYYQVYTEALPFWDDGNDGSGSYIPPAEDETITVEVIPMPAAWLPEDGAVYATNIKSGSTPSEPGLANIHSTSAWRYHRYDAHGWDRGITSQALQLVNNVPVRFDWTRDGVNINSFTSLNNSTGTLPSTWGFVTPNDVDILATIGSGGVWMRCVVL